MRYAKSVKVLGDDVQLHSDTAAGLRAETIAIARAVNDILKLELNRPSKEETCSAPSDVTTLASLESPGARICHKGCNSCDVASSSALAPLDIYLSRHMQARLRHHNRDIEQARMYP